MRKKLLWTTILISLFVSLAMIPAGIASAPTMSVEPSVIWDPGMVPSTIFTVSIEVDYVELLWGYEFALTFNPAVLQGIDVQNGPFLESAGGSVRVFPGEGFDNELGILYLFGAAMSPKRDFPSGGGVLAYVTFHVIGTGSSLVEMLEVSNLRDPEGDIISSGGLPGFFSNAAGPELYVRRGGSGGGPGAWPEYSAPAIGEEQILYSSVANKGAMPATVYVEFRIESVYGTETMVTDPIVVIPSPDDRVTVSTDPFVVLNPEYFYVTATLYFKAGGMTEFAEYTLVEGTLGGFGSTKEQGQMVKYRVH